jgi:Domain of unknown function (DUF1905)
MANGNTFRATLFRYPGKGGWTFAPVPARAAPAVTHGWGRTPVEATIDGHTWATSVWRGKDGRTLLPVPKHIRGVRGDGDAVTVTLRLLPRTD